MQDRPTALELLHAIERFLEEQVVPATHGTVQFHTRVSVNALRIVQRELQNEEEALRTEWAGLDGVLGVATPPATLAALKEGLAGRNEELSELVRSGAADDGETANAIYDHVRQTVLDKAAIADPRLLS